MMVMFAASALRGIHEHEWLSVLINYVSAALVVHKNGLHECVPYKLSAEPSCNCYTYAHIFVFSSSDPTFTTDKVSSVFGAITGDWKKLGLIPPCRAQHLQRKFSPLDQAREAGKYYASYHPHTNWRILSVALYRFGEFKAVQLAKPHMQTVRGI